jgi:hypothetical protein
MLQKPPFLRCHSGRKGNGVLLGNPHVKARSGKASIMNFKELPEGIAGVIPIIFSFFRARSNSVKPKHLDILRKVFFLFLWISPDLASYLDGIF